MFCCLSVVVGRREKGGKFQHRFEADKKEKFDPPYKMLGTKKRRLYPFNRPNSPGAMIVIDYNRKSVPEELFDIIVPFYPELQDIILIRGDDPHPWLAKVVRIQDRAQTVRVLYYENDPTRPGQDLFLPNNTRLAYDYVPWNSIIGLALGEWQGNAWQLF